MRTRTAGEVREFGKRSALRFTGFDSRDMSGPLQAYTNQEYAFARFSRA
jgi:hypothetical protein